MAGYHIYSVDYNAFHQLTTAPTMEQCLILADAVAEDLEDYLDSHDLGDPPDGADEEEIAEYRKNSVDRAKWPVEREALATAIQQRLTSADWYVDLTSGDLSIWERILGQLGEKAGKKIKIKFKCENDGVYWDVAEIAVRHGAPMMAEYNFVNSKFRNPVREHWDLEWGSVFYMPPQTQQLLKQLELAAPHFETLPEEDDDGHRAQFFEELLEPVRKIVKAGRVMWVQIDT